VNEVDWYYVQSAQESAERDARSYTDRAVHESVTSLRREMDDLRDTIAGLQRTLDARTGHLV
jgi:hypothetical protein